jgi:hypothetical protein
MLLKIALNNFFYKKKKITPSVFNTLKTNQSISFSIQIVDAIEIMSANY